MAMNFEPHECIILVHSTKNGTHENKAIHSTSFMYMDNSLLVYYICNAWPLSVQTGLHFLETVIN